MSSSADRLARLRWLVAPLAAYLVITLVLPVANGAAGRADFARHAARILAGCLAAIALVALAQAAGRAARHRRARAPSLGGPQRSVGLDLGEEDLAHRRR
ncbi:MAG TPA: hypothetical protein VHE35_07195 [Kofleriaceae bacterium]|nr:hypothetical protein [Kofleriaceae bacterium]